MKKVELNSTVTVHYTGRLEDGTVFDSSMTEGREPLSTTLGQGSLIAGFEKGLVDMAEGEKKTINIPSSEAYGDVNPSLVAEVPKDRVPEERLAEGGIKESIGDHAVLRRRSACAQGGLSGTGQCREERL